jgi:protein-S-isoprenylcysteine O-methyltransferase Ste14
MGLFERILNAIFSIVIMLIALCFFGYVIPRGIISWDFHLFPLEIGAFRFIGLAPIILGIVTMMGFIWGWILPATGSPLLLDLPKELIVRGSYRFVRNPMYVGVFLILFGEILLFKSSVLLLYLLTLFLFAHLVVVFVEEPMLKHKFGESYEQYCKSVPRWIPRLKAFRGNISRSSQPPA